MLAALKEELFQLEVERQQGKLSPEEYDSARAALEQTLKRALARSGVSMQWWAVFGRSLFLREKPEENEDRLVVEKLLIGIRG